MSNLIAKFKGNKRSAFFLKYFVILAAMIVTGFIITGSALMVFVYNFSVPIFMGNYAFYLVIQGVIYAITGRFKLTVYIFNFLAFILALTNNLVYSFRGTVFLPSDTYTLTVSLFFIMSPFL